MFRSGNSARWWAPALLCAGTFLSLNWAQPPRESQKKGGEAGSISQFVNKHCISCHNKEDKRGDFVLDGVDTNKLTSHPEVWEKVVRKLTARQMPPLGRPRPDEKTYQSIVAALET